MNAIFTIRFGVVTLAFGTLAAMVLHFALPAAAEPTGLVHEGKLGFVVTDFSYGLSTSRDAAVMCPKGLSLGPRDIFAATPEGQRRKDESDADYTRRLGVGAQPIMTAPTGENLCMNPEAGKPDPNLHPVSGDVPVYGIDLDGRASRENGPARLGTCAHDDFRGVNGERGIDNQFFRAVGCTHTLAPGGQANDFGSQMLVGESGHLALL